MDGATTLMHRCWKWNCIYIMLSFSHFYIAYSYCPTNPTESDVWAKWWSYNTGLSGPTHWNGGPDWKICEMGKNQSPINITTKALLYDPHLLPLQIEAASVNGYFRNTERDLTFSIISGKGPYVNITSGPLSYRYRLYQIKLHYGRDDNVGSEHRIDNNAFPGEMQFMAYNAELYENASQSENSPRGIAVISVFLSVSEIENNAFDVLRDKFIDIEARVNKGSCTEINDLNITSLLPKTEQYMTYSGSLTQPGCRETVTWVIFNKPVYLSHQQMSDMRNIPYRSWTTDSNARPLQPLHHRTVRTNINFKQPSRLCSMEIAKKYEVIWRRSSQTPPG